jgi:hypothetical protein
VPPTSYNDKFCIPQNPETDFHGFSDKFLHLNLVIKQKKQGTDTLLPFVNFTRP